ncbi:peptidylprolyl isomerase [Mycobacterium talmoniae]|uniref:Peptidyl-prolyl cis-trans isomerase n=1 Tax=Mycobacterium talmoniae TaxID=1858794 RepID=A0A1S1NEI6_9MYCO|nr:MULTISPECIES: peptidylprolyl isomerase [Mycobacterium]OHV04086.1 peptidylprolyl isomerase [Mycobacterium talmoniae]TDH52697.1 peptidylprolyl isomerase [Mycobacterium eburneum]
MTASRGPHRPQNPIPSSILIGAGIIGAVVIVVAVVFALVSHDSGAVQHPTATSQAPVYTPPSRKPAPPANGRLPVFTAPAGLGANCQYPRTPQPAAKDVDPPRSGRVSTDPAEIGATIDTDQGPIGVTLDNAKAPCTVNSFISLAHQGYFDDTGCHRLTTAASLGVLQCGDPSGDGSGGPGYDFANEYPTTEYPPGDPGLKRPVLYPRGTLAMANAGPNTNGSQFFLVYRDSQLPPQYTVFGTIGDDGLATLDAIAAGGVEAGGRSPEDGAPNTKVTITAVHVD